MTGLDSPPVRYAIDLHSHPYSSDGRPSPAELVEQAAAQATQNGGCSHVGQLRHNSTSHLHQIEASGQARIMPNLQA